jgi:hypothetical protein
MGADEIDLQLLELLIRDPDRSQSTEAGIYAIKSFTAPQSGFDGASSQFDICNCIRGQLDFGTLTGNGDELKQRQMCAVQDDGSGGFRL